jgi:hypothetical protein
MTQAQTDRFARMASLAGDAAGAAAAAKFSPAAPVKKANRAPVAPVTFAAVAKAEPVAAKTPAPEYSAAVIFASHVMDYQQRNVTIKGAFDKNVLEAAAACSAQQRIEIAKRAAAPAAPVVRKSEPVPPTKTYVDDAVAAYAASFMSTNRPAAQQEAIDARMAAALVIAGRSCVL